MMQLAIPRKSDVAGTKLAYANELARLVADLQFDLAYAQEIAAFAEQS